MMCCFYIVFDYSSYTKVAKTDDLGGTFVQ